ncbi:hypothetical protein EDC01DRAFT_627559 [Geopyxis carbonaria]|nr:hypothetical protein EDC01DRAFT_627559 [Geopyxis carbonaria]
MSFDGTVYRHEEIKFPTLGITFAPEDSELIQPPVHIDEDLGNFVEGHDEYGLFENEFERNLGKFSTEEVLLQQRLQSWVPAKPTYCFGSTRLTEESHTKNLIHHFAVPEYPETSEEGIGHVIHLDGTIDPWVLAKNIQYSLYRRGSGNIIQSDFLNTKVKRIYHQCQGVKVCNMLDDSLKLYHHNSVTPSHWTSEPLRHMNDVILAAWNRSKEASNLVIRVDPSLHVALTFLPAQKP